MKKILLFISLFYGFSNALYSQDQNENGVVSFSMPIRNSLKFNRYLINPAFSFVRETSAYASFYNKRQWVQFDNAPQTYLASYSGRFRENEAFAFGLFQQNYGLMTVFGGVGNFAHNIVLQEDSNLTFGLNVGVYKSGLDRGKIITDDIEVLNGEYPSNTLLTVNPGINYGTAFLDFGLSINNLVLYNFGSGMVKDDPERAIQLHGMYTGYLDSFGFFDRSKFSGLVKTEIKKDKTVISGLAMLAIPQGVWAQAGYNTLYGISAGLGVNISPSISIEYNYERGMGNFTNMGGSHEFAIAYKFKSKNYYYGEDEEGSLIDPAKPKPVMAKKTTSAPVTRVSGAETARLAAEAKAVADAEAKQARLAAAEKVKADAEAAAKAKLEADNKAKADAEAIKIKLAADAKAKADAAASARAQTATANRAVATTQKTQTQLAADKARADAEARRIKLAADNKARVDAAAAARAQAIANKPAAANAAPQKTQAQLAADKAKADAEALKVKLAADAKAKTDAEALRIKLAADNKAKADAAEAKRKAEAKAKAEEADLQSILAADAKAKADSDALQAKLAAEAKAKAAAEAKTKASIDAANKAKLASDAKAKAAADAALKEKLAADAKAKADAEARQALIAAEAKAKADAEALKIKLAADAKAKADAEAQAKLAAEAKAKADAEALQAKLVADAKAKADAQAKLAAEAKAKADAEALQAKLAAEAKVKADAEAEQARLAAEAKAKADMAALQAKLIADARVKADAEATAKAKADAEAKQLQQAEEARLAKLAAEAKAKADAEALKAKQAAEEKAKADALQAKLAADAKAKADAEALQAKLAADAKAKADAEALQAKLAADAKAKADAEALRVKQAAEEKAKADAEARQAKLAADAKAKADMEAAQAKLLADAKAKADAEATEKMKAEEETRQLRLAEEAREAKLLADAKAKADAEALQARLAAEAAAKAAATPKDDTAKAIENLTQSLENSSKVQKDLLSQFNTTVANKQRDLNDLSEKGIYKEPKPFKSVAAENSQLEALKGQLADASRMQKEEIAKLTNLYNERLKKVPNKNDALNKAYLDKINELKAAQLKMEQDSAVLLSNLERIKTETEIEKKRRIKRAAYENDQGRYAQDVAALKRIKETTKLSSTPLKASDFDFGEDQSNMQIIKNIKNSDNGYYLIIAVHNSVEKRDEFLRKAVAAGRTDVNFFYNVTTSKYYIYYDKFDGLPEATKALEAKGSKPYNGKMAIVKVEN
ncbi:PorP/SprF family type IX secretion system membrane protein [Flavobacterium sp. FlaQc-28]|uniref:PorP/SprF family type IX secretion system membrane protein n=1 Tax=Flavobacterium sp. FlaQc-28 TaxID=3374178 RepID=UPI0037575421